LNIFDKPFSAMRIQNISKVIHNCFLVLFFSISLNATPCLAQSGLQQFDEQTLINISRRRTPEKTNIFLFLSKKHLYGDLGVPASLFLGGIATGDLQMRQNALYVASSTAVSAGFTFLLKQLGKRKRPFVKNINIVPVYIAKGSSFPSGHTSASTATAVALLRAYPKWYVIAPSLLWAGSVGYSRMYLGLHYPSDVAAGTVIGAGSALLLPKP